MSSVSPWKIDAKMMGGCMSGRLSGLRLERLPQRFRRHFSESVAVTAGKTPELEEAERHRHIRDRGFSRIRVLQRGMRRFKPLLDRIALRADADHVVERGPERALADAGHLAQVGNRDGIAGMLLQERG